MIRSIATFALVSFGLIAQADEMHLDSQVRDIEIARLSQVPENRSGSTLDVPCSAIIDAPETAVGRKVADKGWWVTAEIERDNLTLIGFVGKVEPATSGTCYLSNGNIGIFRGQELIAVIYARQPVHREIGSITVKGDGGLRIWEGRPLGAPLADLEILQDDLVIIRHIASRDSFCEGAASVPNIHGLQIHIARRLLIVEGWQPSPASRDVSSSFVEEMRKSFPELQDCAETGFGFCQYAYSAGNESLSVVTAGEGSENTSPRVTSFSAACEMDDTE